MRIPDQPSPGALLARITAAIGLLEAGDVDAAEQAALTLCEDYPRVADGFVLQARCAAARGEGGLALERWQACAARFEDQAAKWQVGLAYAYLNEDRLPEAARAFAAVLAGDPTHQGALAGQATVVSRTDPGEAEPLWQRLFALVGGPPKPGWQITRSRALADCGRIADAVTVLDQVLRDRPGFQPAVAMLANLRKTASVEPMPRERHLERAQRQRRSQDITGARASLTEALGSVRDAEALSSLLQILPGVFRGFEQTQAWRALRSRATAILPPEAPDTICLQLRVDLGLRDHDAFLHRWAGSPPLPEPWGRRFGRLAAVLQAPTFPDFTAPKVFGIGLAKTGTSSLGWALERLGYLQAHFENPFTGDLLTDADFVLFDAASDSPVTARFEMLYTQYPNARFILTERPMDTWLPSFNGHFARWRGRADAPFLTSTYADLKDALWGLDIKVIDSSLYSHHGSPLAAYAAHERRVDRFFADKPAGKLLRHNIFTGDGWPELCAFLGHDVPAEPYPWANPAPQGG